MTLAASIILVLLATYWFGFKEGFSGVAHLAYVVVAGAFASRSGSPSPMRCSVRAARGKASGSCCRSA